MAKFQWKNKFQSHSSNLKRIHDGSVLGVAYAGISYRLVKIGGSLICFRVSDSKPLIVENGKVNIDCKWVSINKLTHVYG